MGALEGALERVDGAVHVTLQYVHDLDGAPLERLSRLLKVCALRVHPCGRGRCALVKEVRRVEPQRAVVRCKRHTLSGKLVLESPHRVDKVALDIDELAGLQRDEVVYRDQVVSLREGVLRGGLVEIYIEHFYNRVSPVDIALVYLRKCPDLVLQRACLWDRRRGRISATNTW